MNSLGKAKRILGSVATLISITTACGTTPVDAPVDAVSVVLSRSAVTLAGVGQTTTISATVSASSGPVAAPTVTWTTSNASIATVTGAGSIATIAAVGSGVATITATSRGASATATVTVAAAANAALSATPASLSIVQGGVGTSTINIARTNYSGAVTLTASGAPVGMTVTIAGSPTVSTSAAVSVAVAGSTAPGSYQVTVTGSGTGIANVTTALTIVVSPATSSMTLDLTSCADTSGWMAVQDGPSAPWVRVIGQAGIFRPIITAASASIAYSSRRDRTRTTFVVSDTRAALLALPPDQLCETREPPNFFDSKKQFVQPMPSDLDIAYTGFGGVTHVSFAGPTAGVLGPETGVHDLLVVGVPGRNSADTLARAVVRRGINTSNFPNGSVIGPPLVFTGPDAGVVSFTRFSPALTSAEWWGIDSFALVGAGCWLMPLPRETGEANLFRMNDSRGLGFLYSSPHRMQPKGGGILLFEPTQSPLPAQPVPGNTLIAGLPANLPAFTGMHAVDVLWHERASGLTKRVFQTSPGSPSGSYALPSSIPATTPTVVAGNGYRRLSFGVTLPADISDAGVILYYGSADGNLISMRFGASFLGGRTLNATTPDFAGVPGWRDEWGPHGTAAFSIWGEGNTRASSCSAGRTVVSGRAGIS